MKYLTGQIFKTLRKASNEKLTNEKLAEALDISTTCLASTERGAFKVSEGTVKKYCFYYNIPETELFPLVNEVMSGNKSDINQIAIETENLYSKYNN